MSDTSDEYSAFDFSEFTEDDLKRIDADVEGKALSGGPSLLIELEPPPATKKSPTNVTGGRSELTPYREFRPGGVFSVTDLAAPAWYVGPLIEGRRTAHLLKVRGSV
jgi:hypothetical protein